MTFEITCSKCGCVLHSGFDLKSPADAIKQFGDRCKECGVRLATDSFRIEVEKFAGSFVPSHVGASAISVPLRVRPAPDWLHLKSEVAA